MGDGRAEGSSVIGDGGQVAFSLTSDIDCTVSSSLLDSILCALLINQSTDIEVVVFCSVAQSCLTLCYPSDCSMPVFTVPYYLPEFA